MIELKKVGKVFRTANGDVEALKDIDLTVNDGEIFGIIGLSGAGKSTLVRCINMLERPTSGEVLIDGRDLSKMSRRELLATRKSIGMIFQGFNLLAQRTSLQNVCYPLEISGVSKAKAKQKALELLELVGLSDRAGSYPAQLSGGQKQRVAIARALATDPKVLLCDEATSALDPQTTKQILALLQKLNRELGITIVVITHEMAVVKEICNRVAVMEHGNVVEEGDVFSVFAAPKEKITRDFIKTTSNLQKIEELINEDSPVVAINKGELIVRLSYIEKNASEPLISSVTEKFGLTLNIIFADIEIVQNAPIGGTVAIISGDPGRIDEALQYLKDKNVGVEVIKDGRVS